MRLIGGIIMSKCWTNMKKIDIDGWNDHKGSKL